MRRVTFILFSPINTIISINNEHRRRGGALPDYDFFCSFFPCSADHQRDWPPCKVVFFGLGTNTLSVRNNNNNNKAARGFFRSSGVNTVKYLYRLDRLV